MAINDYLKPPYVSHATMNKIAIYQDLRKPPVLMVGMDDKTIQWIEGFDKFIRTQKPRPFHFIINIPPQYLHQGHASKNPGNRRTR